MPNLGLSYIHYGVVKLYNRKVHGTCCWDISFHSLLACEVINFLTSTQMQLEKCLTNNL